ncbi:MAG: GNAT family N-acetyltransferase [Lewinellaceae bacterium]|nr:GNAT family N-acetyltransferase [Lewinellaceae bacterium]
MHILLISFGTPEFDDALRLRDLVLRKPLGMQYQPEQIAEEYDTVHMGIYTSSYILAGYLNLVPQSDTDVKMRQVAVEPAFQRKGVGLQLVLASERWAKEHGFTAMVLNAREVAVPFYLKAGYQIEGERFDEVGIPHFKMKKKMK